VDLRATPIERITATGLRTSDSDHAFDMIIYATGFDAITGGFDRVDIQGRDGQKLKDKWADGPQTYLGLQIEGFPNLLTLIGPHNAATFCNMPRCIEQNVDWVTELLAHMREQGMTGSRRLRRRSVNGPRTPRGGLEAARLAGRLLMTRVNRTWRVARSALSWPTRGRAKYRRAAKRWRRTATRASSSRDSRRD